MNKTQRFYAVINEERFDCEARTDVFEDKSLREANKVALVLTMTLRDADAFWGDARLKSLAQRLARKAPSLGGVCVGTRLAATNGRVYFYCADINAADSIENAPKGGFALIEGSAFADSEWTIYQKEVRPTAAQIQTIANAELILQYKKRGDDPLVLRRVNHHVSFTDEVSLTGFAMEAKNAGFALSNSHYNGDAPRPNGIFVHNITAINSQSIDVSTTKLIEIAQKYGGGYDYWDCPVMKKNKL